MRNAQCVMKMRQKFFLLLFDALISGGLAAWLYFTRGVDSAIATGLSVFIAGSPICFVLAEAVALFLTRRRLKKLGVTLNDSSSLKTLAEAQVK